MGFFSLIFYGRTIVCLLVNGDQRRTDCVSSVGGWGKWGGGSWMGMEFTSAYLFELNTSCETLHVVLHVA